MKTQTDYETDPTLAIFDNPERAEEARRRLQALGISDQVIRQAPLAPGRYQCVDPSFGEEVSGILRGAEVGLPAGAVLGVGMAASLGGAGLEVFAGLAGAGAVIGAVVGSLEGAAIRAHYDDDVAQWIEVSDGGSTVLLVVGTHSDGTTGRTRQALRRAGALAFLDPEVNPAD